VTDKQSTLARLSQQIMRLLGQWQVQEQQFALAANESVQIAQSDPFRLALYIGAVSAASSASGDVMVSTLPGVPSTAGVMLSDHPVGHGIVYPLWGELVSQPWYAWTGSTNNIMLTVLTVRAQQ
jgi:hypothetical protein